MSKRISAGHCVPAPNRKSWVFLDLCHADDRSGRLAVIIDIADRVAARREAVRLLRSGELVFVGPRTVGIGRWSA